VYIGNFKQHKLQTRGMETESMTLTWETWPIVETRLELYEQIEPWFAKRYPFKL